MAAGWEEKAQEAGLDERTFEALQAVPTERAHQILDGLLAKGAQVRNPSAFVSKAAREMWDEGETLRRALESDFWRSILDDAAMAELLKVDPGDALAVLADVRALGGQVRNPSSYVCGTLRKRLAEGKAAGGGVSAVGCFPPMAYPVMPAIPASVTLRASGPGVLLTRGGMSSVGPPAYAARAAAYAAQQQQQASYAVRTPMPAAVHKLLPAPPPPAPPLPQVVFEATPEEKAEIDQLIAELAPDLDARAKERVHQLGSPLEARSALEALAEMGSEVRNRSAFMHSIVTRRLQVAAEAMAAEEEMEMVEQQQSEEEELLVELEAQMKSWGEDLDEGARKVLAEVQDTLGAGVALQILEELAVKLEQGELRNASGFAFSMARARLSGASQATLQGRPAGYSPPILVGRGPQATLQGRPAGYSAPILVGRATPPATAGGGHGGGAAAAPAKSERDHAVELERHLRAWGEDLDEKAREMLGELQLCLGSAVALGVMKELATKVEKENVRNISSFVYSMSRQRLGGAGFQAAPAFGPATAPAPPPPPLVARPAQAPAQQRAPLLARPPQGQAQRGPLLAPPQSRRPGSWLEETLAQCGLAGRLDDVVLQRMEAAQPERVREILQDLLEKDDIRNPSAFIQKSLKDFPQARKHPSQQAPDTRAAAPPAKRARVEPQQDFLDPLASFPELVDRMDEAAILKLQGHPDQARVRDVLAEMAAKMDEIRNPSAFAVRALTSGPY